MESAPLQELRRLLATPSQASWRALCETFLAEVLFPQVYQEVTQRLGAWSDELREVPVAWLLAPTLARDAAPLLRALSLDADLWPEASLEALLTTFTSLRRLSLEGASTKDVQVFSHAKTALTHLTITRSTLAQLDALRLSPEDPLLSLELSHNQLSQLSLASLPRSLQTLDLSHNQLSLWQDEEAALPMLQSLSLAHNLYQAPASLEAFWRSRSFPMLREVDLSGLLHAAEPLYYHAKPSPLCQNLQALSLNHCGVSDEQLESLSRRSDSFSRLRELHLSDNPITDDGLSLLGMSLVGKRLHALSLSGNAEVSGFELQPFQMLKSLSVQGDGASTWVSAEALRELPWHTLEALSLPDLLLTDELFEVLEELPFSLSSLDLSKNQLSARGLRRFLMRCNLSGLRRLSLARNPLQSGVAFLAEYESTHHLEHLDLSETQLDAGALSVVFDWMTALLDEGFGLRSLSLSGNALSGEAIEALSRCRGSASLTELHLSACGLNARDLQLLAGSSHLQQLKVLSLDENPLEEPLAVILQGPALVGVSTLSLSAGQVSAASLREHARHLLRPLRIVSAKPIRAANTAGSSA